MQDSTLNWFTAAEAARSIEAGEISAEQFAEACLARVHDVEARVQAWAFLDPDHVMQQARARDQERREGCATGPLHGVPVGIKDIFDTADMPTEDGSELHAGRTPAHDATVVAMLRAAGAVIMGKTVTTEFAAYSPGKTRNPVNPSHTPGGSSSGSAAAVAAGMVPLALGSQTNGSVIRPAAFCGVYGFKPTHGLIPRGGMLTLSRTLDHVGAFARSLEDIAWLVEQLVGADPRDPDTRPRARPPLLATLRQEPPTRPLLAWLKCPPWLRASTETTEAFAELRGVLEAHVAEVELPDSSKQALDWHRTIMEAEMAANLDREWDKAVRPGQAPQPMSESLRALLERGRALTALDYQRARARVPALNAGFDEIFDRCDAIVAPAAPGTAPVGLDSTGDPSFCTLWTLCGMPALSLPLLQGENGLPLGVQLIGRRHDDARLLRTARWLVAHVARSAS